MRRGLRRPYRLVRVEIHGDRLNVFTGTGDDAFLRAGARARRGAGAFRPGALEMLRRLAFWLAGGSSVVSGSARGGDGGNRLGIRRDERGRR